MATVKKTVTKPIAKKNKVEITTETVVKPLTTEDLLLGNAQVMETVTKTNYESEHRKYKVTNLQVDNKPVKVDGTVIETFIGSGNLNARKELIGGAKSVVTKDAQGKNAYKLEVIE